MNCDIGNDHAIEVVDGAVVRVLGEQVTSFLFPEGVGVLEASAIVVATVPFHIEEGFSPAWVQCSDGGLQAILCSHFKLPPTSSKPANWGLPKPPKQSKSKVVAAVADTVEGEV